MSVRVDPSFDAFVADRSTALLRMAYLLTGDRGYAEDLLQTALLRVFRHWSRAREAPEAYARQVLVNLSRDRLRRMFRRPLEIPLPANPELLRGTDCGIDRATERRVMVRALTELPVRQREVLVLRFFADLSVARNAAYVADRAVAALDAASDRVAHIQGALGGQTLEQWRDPAASRWRVDETGPDGRPHRAMLVTGPDDGTRTVLTVDYADRAWWTYRLDQPEVPSDVSWIAMSDGPEDIQDDLRRLSLHVVGTERVDGQDTVHLGGPRPTGKGIAVDIWIDAATYLPVRIAFVSPDLSVTSRYTWLPRTPENLAPFDLEPPAGFTQRQR